ncbi:hypothetical protein FIU94_16410 [Sulfitobacter sp. THAF37]|uniref:DUF1206 domain-containing protein n=1 Tax=Sulfitobacter sp. THAF37 TaxID=2587855 RepID=UPI0012A7A122|nr:DUF1206 domain-containing protein [Sulfitobacter sp. THAF37]QFT60414.1 hypothetical protein FIU94_16410 [Sulfitobacter sp. THAF37]
MADKSHEGLKWVMRAGYGARAMIYATIGILAIFAAFSSVEASGTKDSLQTLRAQPFGIIALWMIGIGLLGYMVWRVIAGIADVEDHGTDAKGIVARAGQVTTGLIHAGIGVSVLSLAMGTGGSGGDSTQDWTARLMSMPMGRYIVAVGALVLLGAGVYYCYKGWSGKYKEHLAASTFTTRFDPAIKGGLVIYGILLSLVALSIGIAALNADPSQAGGLGKALHTVRAQPYGPVLLGLAGLGLLGFALYNMIEAVFRIVPKVEGPDVETLAKAATG